ncbi:MAG: hypothetical protein HRU15_06345, partial [Planctomycetes bacterium]|nr:hypothetical protein [Planctomycetota bacterium]
MTVSIKADQHIHRCGEQVTFSIRIEGEIESAQLCLSEDGYTIIEQRPLDVQDASAHTFEVSGSM